MAITQGIRAGRAFVEIFADDSRLVRGLHVAENRLKAFGASIRSIGLQTAGLGMTILAPMGAAAKAFADAGSRVWDMAQRTGVSVEALSALTYAAEQTGTSVEALETGLRAMQRALWQAERGGGSATVALSQLGLTAAALKGLAPEAQFRAIADRLAQVVDPSHRAALAMALFGRSGTELLPMLAGGAAALDAYMQRARELGLIMRTEDAAAADQFGDALADLWRTVKVATYTVGAALAPTLKDLAERLASVMVRASQWVAANREVVVSAMKIAAVVVAVGAGLTAFGTVVSAIGMALGALTKIIAVVRFALVGMASMVALLTTPIGLVIAAIGALGAALLHVTGAGRKALDWLRERFEALGDAATASFRRIGVEQERAQEALARAGRMTREEQEQLGTEYAERIAATEAELEHARREWETALETAEKARLGLAPAPTPAGVAETLADIGDIPEVLAEQAKRIDVIGTFSPEALERLGVGPTAAGERTARACEETARNTKRIYQRLEDVGAVFVG